LRSLILLLIGAVIGAVLFHVYYLKLDESSRCGWDHPLSEQLAAKCRLGVEPPSSDDVKRTSTAGSKSGGYAKRARHELDDLIGNVSR
jgi:hypothetical protein